MQALYIGYISSLAFANKITSARTSVSLLSKIATSM